MGSGSMKSKSYTTKTGYYLTKDFDVKVGGEFHFLLTPLHGNNNERFFYVEENLDGTVCLLTDLFCSTWRRGCGSFEGKGAERGHGRRCSDEEQSL